MKNLIVASTSTVYNGTYLEYLLEDLELLFSETDEIIFIPYARPGGISYDDYTQKAETAFSKISKSLKGLHTFNNPLVALSEAKGIFTGGGNTFELVNALYRNRVMQPLRETILDGAAYLGTSAGSNICGLTMQTTNDMPIVYPPSFKTLGVIPYNINPHYMDPDPESQHMGETRETRINEFHKLNSIPVVGLREGSWLRVEGDQIKLHGTHTARIFQQNKTPYEVESGTFINRL